MRVQRSIDKYGWSSVVTAPLALPSVPFVYSCGFTAQGWPELAILGLDIGVAHGLLASAWTIGKAGAPVSAPGERSDLANLPLRVRAISAEPLVLARALHPVGPTPFDEAVTALQLLWPVDGQYPDQPGWSRPGAQPLLDPPG